MPNMYTDELELCTIKTHYLDGTLEQVVVERTQARADRTTILCVAGLFPFDGPDILHCFDGNIQAPRIAGKQHMIYVDRRVQ